MELRRILVRTLVLSTGLCRNRVTGNWGCLDGFFRLLGWDIRLADIINFKIFYSFLHYRLIELEILIVSEKYLQVCSSHMQ